MVLMGDWGVAASPTVSGFSSKLTLTDFFFLPVPPSSESSERASEVSLAALELENAGDVGREVFKTDFAGEMPRLGGICLVPSVTGLSEKCAERAGLTDMDRETPAIEAVTPEMGWLPVRACCLVVAESVDAGCCRDCVEGAGGGPWDFKMLDVRSTFLGAATGTGAYASDLGRASRDAARAWNALISSGVAVGLPVALDGRMAVVAARCIPDPVVEEFES